MSTDTFGTFGVPAQLTAVLTRDGITTPTPIQAATLPDSLAGRDVLGRGRTGSGKTLAFLLPLVTRLSAAKGRTRPGRPRALILAPTRELVTQIDTALAPLAAVAGLTSRTVFGGVGQGPQVTALRQGVDILVACPGRLEDLMGQGHARLDDVEVTVLDEADHMADLGFLPGVTRILAATPARSQRLLFSATLDSAIRGLVRRFLHDPVTHEADSDLSPVTAMEHHVLHVREDDHFAVLADLAAAPGRTVVFARTKHRAKRMARQLNSAGVPSVELHGNLGQNARTRNLEAFHAGTAQTLVATDIAARGIHVDDVGLVVHADPPVEHKAYLHRSGRTARAGAAGTVITLMTDAQTHDVRDLVRKAGIRPTTTRVRAGDAFLHTLVAGERSYPGPFVEATATPARASQGGSAGSRRRSRQGGRGQRPAERRPAGQGSSSAPSPSAPARSAPSRSGSTRSGATRSASSRSGSGRSGSTRSASTRSASPRGGGQTPATGGRSGGGAAAFSASTKAGRSRGR